MHKLLQQVGRQAIHRQEPWKRHILIDAHEICYVLENDTVRLICYCFLDAHFFFFIACTNKFFIWGIF